MKPYRILNLTPTRTETWKTHNLLSLHQIVISQLMPWKQSTRVSVLSFERFVVPPHIRLNLGGSSLYIYWICSASTGLRKTLLEVVQAWTLLSSRTGHCTEIYCFWWARSSNCLGRAPGKRKATASALMRRWTRNPFAAVLCHRQRTALSRWCQQYYHCMESCVC